MIALWLLSAHLTGDFVLQTRYQTAFKRTRRRVRATHATIYVIPFLPVAAWETRSYALTSGFLAGLAALHYLVDSNEYRSTLADVLSWRLDVRRDIQACQVEWFRHLTGRPSSLREVDLTGPALRYPPPNPWPLTHLTVEQTLRMISLTLLGTVILR